LFYDVSAMKTPNSLSSKDLLNLYYFMRLNRAVEDRLIALYRQSVVTATVFSSRGQEATSVGSAYALEEQDFVSPITRNLGTMLVRGILPRDIFTQYMGKATSPTKGKERIHYFGDLKKGVVASLSILGDMIPVMAGVALAARIKNRPSVALTYIGEGASATGEFHEGMNLASVLGLGFVLIIENNQYAYSTPARRAAAVADFATRARCYGIPSVIVDGNDVLAVYEVTREAVVRARSGNGPTIIEAKTMRMHGHSDADNSWYVPKEELDEWGKKDPIDRFDKELRNAGILDGRIAREVESRIHGEIERDLEYALQSPMPDPEVAVEGVYHDHGQTGVARTT
jgi:TPP-dependent pyruvate/acetoin dehydrogenase alpha subunit